MKIVLDHEGCNGCGLCIATCPTVFQMAEDGRAHTVQPAVTEQEQHDGRPAAENCPVSVSAIEEKGGTPAWRKKRNAVSRPPK